jgi:hypothetical protein
LFVKREEMGEEKGVEVFFRGVHGPVLRNASRSERMAVISGELIEYTYLRCRCEVKRNGLVS